MAQVIPLRFFLSSPPSDPAIRILHAGRSYVAFLAHDNLSNQDIIGWLYEQPSDDVAQLALDCLLSRGEHATVAGYDGMVATYCGNESTDDMDAAVEAEIAEREPTDDEMQSEREGIWSANAFAAVARGAA